MKFRCLTLTLALSLAAPLAGAESLVQMKGQTAQPGVVTAWKAKGKTVELSLKADADADAVMEAIKQQIPGVRVKKRAGKILVSGKSEADLLKALSSVDPAKADDTMGLLADAASTEESFDSGSSLRAKITQSEDKRFLDKAHTLLAQVTWAEPGMFPDAALTLRVLEPPTGALGADLAKGAQIQLKPVFHKTQGKLDLSQADNQANLLAYYLKTYDRVEVVLGPKDGQAYTAVVLRRH